MTETRRDYEWLKRAIEAATRQVAAWPEWKRNGSTLRQADLEESAMANDEITFTEAEREFLESFVKILHHLHGRAVRAEREVVNLRKELEVKRDQVEAASILKACTGEPAGPAPLIRCGEGDPVSDPGFQAGSPVQS